MFKLAQSGPFPAPAAHGGCGVGSWQQQRAGSFMGFEGANLLGRGGWIPLGSVGGFCTSFSLRLLHPEETSSPAWLWRFLRKSVNNTKGKRKHFADEFEEYIYVKKVTIS